MGADEPIQLILDLPFNWYLLYFAAVSFFTARLIYLARCPGFLKRYRSSAEATADGLTAELVRDEAALYANEFDKRRVHPLSEEGVSLDSFLQELLGPNDVVEKLYDGESTGSTPGGYIEIISSARLAQIPETSSYVIKDSKFIKNEDDARRSVNLLIWKLLELQDLSRPKQRALTLFIVGMGILFLSIPILQGFQAVLRAFLNWP
jgi:hypothetical protein